jgi:hypothetical protein
MYFIGQASRIRAGSHIHCHRERALICRKTEMTNLNGVGRPRLEVLTQLCCMHVLQRMVPRYLASWRAEARPRFPPKDDSSTGREKVVQCNGTQRHRLPRTGNMEPGPPLTLGTEHRLSLGSQRFASLTEEQNRVNENSRDMFPSSLTHASCFASVRFHGCGSAFSPTARQKDRRVSRSQVSRSTGIINMDVISIP